MNIRRKAMQCLVWLINKENKKRDYTTEFNYDDNDMKHIELLNSVISEQKEEIEEYERTLDVFDERKYRKKYLRDRRKKEPNMLYPDADEVYERYYEQKEQIKKLERQVKIKNNYLDLIYCIGYDYDGYEKAESLKSLIDELVDYAVKGMKNDDKTVIYEGGKGTKQNILYEKLK